MKTIHLGWHFIFTILTLSLASVLERILVNGMLDVGMPARKAEAIASARAVAEMGSSRGERLNTPRYNQPERGTV